MSTVSFLLGVPIEPLSIWFWLAYSAFPLFVTAAAAWKAYRKKANTTTWVVLGVVWFVWLAVTLANVIVDPDLFKGNVIWQAPR